MVKVLALRSTIKIGHFDWLLWMDSDALITNLETRLPHGKETDLVLSRDCGGTNMVVFMMQCSHYSSQLLEESYSGSHVTNDTINHRH